MVNSVASRLIKRIIMCTQLYKNLGDSPELQGRNAAFPCFLMTVRAFSALHSKVDGSMVCQSQLQDKYGQCIFFSSLLLLIQQARQALGNCSSPKSFVMALATFFLPLSPGWDSGIITTDSSRQLTQDLYSAQ